jgi:hypothetical protein
MVNLGAKGPIPHPWTEGQWAGLDGETVGESGEPPWGFVPVVRFLLFLLNVMLRLGTWHHCGLLEDNDLKGGRYLSQSP